MNAKNKLLTISAFVIIALGAVLAVFFSSQKQGYFIDEIFSYTLANSNIGKTKNLTGITYGQWIESDYFTSLLEVSETERFAYDLVISNQSRDVHPPFYYLILHTICSFFPNTFSIWFGLSLNIVLYILSNIFLYLLGKRIFANQSLPLLTIIFWGFSAGAISTVLFIRMYMLLTLLSVIFIYLHFVLLDEQSNAALIYLGIVTYLGFMTHYYFLIFIFFWSVLYAVYFLLQINRKQLNRYLLVILTSLVTGMLTFPSSIYHIFLSYRSAGTTDRLAVLSEYFYRLKSYFSKLSDQQFFGLLGLLFIILFGLSLLKFVQILISSKSNPDQPAHNSNQPLIEAKLCFDQIKDLRSFFVNLSTNNLPVLFLAISTALTFCVAAIVSPHETTRYIYFLYPFISLLTIFFVARIMSLYITDQRFVILGILLLVTAILPLSYKDDQVEYIEPGYDEILSTAQALGEYDCVYFTSELWIVNDNIIELENFKRTYIIDPDNMSLNPEVLDINQDRQGMVLYIDKNLNQDDFLTRLLAASPLENPVFIYSTHYAMVYLVE